MKLFHLFFVLLYLPLFSTATIPKQNRPFQEFISSKEKENIVVILKLPLENRKQALKTYDGRTFTILKTLATNKKENIGFRWKSLTSLARIYPKKSYPIIQSALKSSNCLIRNAGLVSMEIINPEKSLEWAGYFLDDSSLIVRTAAVDLIKKLRAEKYKIQLMEKLNAPDSFYKNKSLWIRHHIVSALVDFSEPGEEKFFVFLLHDEDPRIHSPAIAALEKLTGETFDLPEKTKNITKTKKQMWISWWSENRLDSSSL